MEVVIKGGNIFFLLRIGIRKFVDIDIVNIVYKIVLCIILKFKYILFKLIYIVVFNVYLIFLGIMLYLYFRVL